MVVQLEPKSTYFRGKEPPTQVMKEAKESEPSPSPKYRLNLKVVMTSVFIWMGTFLVFTAISVTLAITTNPMYFLFIIMGLVVSTFAMAFYKPEGPWEPMVPYSKLCEPKLETHAPIYVEEKSSIYPPSPSVKSATRSDPWLCTSAKTALKGSFSSPRLHCRAADDTWPIATPVRNSGAHLHEGFLPLIPTVVHQSASFPKLPISANCEEVRSVSHHQAYKCYGSRVIRTTYGGYPTDDCKEPNPLHQEATPLKAAARSKPLTTTIEMEVKEVPTEKKRRRLLWNLFDKSDKAVVKEFPADNDNDSNAGLLAHEVVTSTSDNEKGSNVAGRPEYRNVVETIDKTIREASAIINCEGEKISTRSSPNKESAPQPVKPHCPKTKAGSALFESSPETQCARGIGIFNSTDSSTSSPGIPSFWQEQASPPDSTPPRSPTESAMPSVLSSTSRLSSGGGSTPKDTEHRYLNEAFLQTRSSWDEVTVPESTTPFQNRTVSSASTGLGCKPDAEQRRADHEIWGSPRWSPTRVSVGDKGSQASLKDFGLQSCGDDKDLFRMSPLVKAELVEVTVINNPPPGSGSQQGLAEAADRKPAPSKYVQATSKTLEAGVQMGHQAGTCDGDSPTKKSKRSKLKLIRKFLKAKKKK